MNSKYQIQFIHRCVVLLEAGISLQEALAILLNLEKHKKRQEVLTLIKISTENGISFHRSLLDSGVAFNSTFLSLVSIGESSGTIPQSIRQALILLEKRTLMKKKIVGALVYPAFIGCVTFGMTAFLVMYIFPKIIPLFSSMNIELPLLTQIVKRMYELTSRYFISSFMIVAISLILCIILYKKYRPFTLAIQRTILHIPLVSTLLIKHTLSNYFRTIGTLLDCGQVLPHIILEISNSCSLLPFRKAFRHSHETLIRGSLISQSFRHEPRLFPLVSTELIAIGERTGSLASMFINAAKVFEEEVDEFIKRLNEVIEPVLMIAMGLIVGSIALSIVLPIYEVTNHLQH